MHELSHLDQDNRGFCPTIAFDMAENERLTLMIEADAQAVATLYTWDLAAAGQPAAWQAAQDLPEYGDIARAFLAVMDGPAPSREAALSAALDQWFASAWRVESYRLDSCSAYLDALDAAHWQRSYCLLPPGFSDTLCDLPNGGRSPCDAPDLPCAA